MVGLAWLTRPVSPLPQPSSIQHVRRLLRELALPELLGAVQGAQQEMLAVRSSKPRLSSKEAAARARLGVTGRALRVAAGQCARVLRACLDCADALAVEVAQGYFLNLALLLLALLGRVHALVRHAGVMAVYVGQALLAQQQQQRPPSEAGAGAAAEPVRVPALSSGRLARALGLQVKGGGRDGARAASGSGAHVASTTTEEDGAETGAGTAAVGAGDDEDDLGVALGPVLARMALPEAPAPSRGLTTRVIPAANGKGAQGRALLASDWSSSSEEEEVLAVTPAPVLSEVAEEDEEEDEEDDGPLFVLDREPEPQWEAAQPPAPPPAAAAAAAAAKPGKKKKKGKKEKERVGHKPPAKAAAPLPVPSFPTQQPPRLAPTPAPTLPSIGKKRKPKPKHSPGEEKAVGGKGGLLDDIDAIFKAAAPQGKKRRKD